MGRKPTGCLFLGTSLDLAMKTKVEVERKNREESSLLGRIRNDV